MPFGVFDERERTGKSARNRGRVRFHLVEHDAGFDRRNDGSLSLVFASPWIVRPLATTDWHACEGRKNENNPIEAEKDRRLLCERAADLTASELARSDHAVAHGGFLAAVRWINILKDKEQVEASEARLKFNLLSGDERKKANYARVYLIERTFNWRRDKPLAVERIGSRVRPDPLTGFGRIIGVSPPCPQDRLSFYTWLFAHRVVPELNRRFDSEAGFPARTIAAATAMQARMNDPAFWLELHRLRPASGSPDAFGEDGGDSAAAFALG